MQSQGDNNLAAGHGATPSKLRAPKQKLDDIAPVLNDRGNAMRPRLMEDSSSSTVSVTGDRLMKTYKGGVNSTMAPVTKAAMRKSAANLRASSSSGGIDLSGHAARSNAVKSARLEEMERMMEEFRAKLENTVESNENMNSKLQTAEVSISALQEERNSLTERMASKERQINDLEEQLSVLRRKATTERDELESLMRQKETDLRQKLQLSEEECERVRRQWTMEKESQTAEMKSKVDRLQAALDAAEQEMVVMKATISRQSTTAVEYDASLRELNAQLQAKDILLDAERNRGGNLSKDLDLLKQQLEEASVKLQQGEAIRRRLHNQVQELKGNIRVFCRIRPLLKDEVGPSSITVLPGADEYSKQEVLLQQSEKQYNFGFDRVFGEASSQEMVFEEISQLVQSALDGYRVCIFAYGQTGSGKTFTMEGSERNLGMIPRAVEQIFANTGHLVQRGWSFSFEASYLEIYNETIRDLLASSVQDSAKLKHEIRHVDGKTTVSDLTVVSVSEGAQVLELLKRAASNRAVGETQCNERSSRSHSVFTLNIVGENAETKESVSGVLNLIDLAGSERLSQSGATGDRLKETQAINKSLSSLGDVIHALASAKEGASGHIPYRNSKLTYLLQTSLGGNSKTLMFVNISPESASANESLCSLRFATKVNSCHIGSAKRMK